MEAQTPTSTSPTIHALAAALNHRALARVARQPANWPAMALHLALPISDAVGMQARITDTDTPVANWRGQVTIIDTSSLVAVTASVLDLVDSATAPGDQFLDLSADPLTWVKPIRSGNRTLAVGTDLLFGGPRLALDPEVDPACLVELLEVLHARSWPHAGPVEIATGAFEVRGDLVSMVVSPAMPPSVVALPLPAPSSAEIDHLGRDLAAEIGGQLREVVSLAELSDAVASVEYVIDLDTHTEAIVASQVDGRGAAAVGYQGTWVPGKHTIPGWRVLGPAVLEPGWVAIHCESHLRALIRTSQADVMVPA